MKTLPSHVKRSLKLNKLPLPVMFFIAGLICFGQYLSELDYQRLTKLGENSTLTEATVTDTWTESMFQPGFKVLYGYAYTFLSAQGELVHSQSYSTIPPHKTGKVIQVKYKAEQPHINRAVGMSGSPANLLTVALGGLLIVVAGLWLFFGRYFQLINILTNRRLAYGQLTHSVRTSIKMNNRRVYELYYQFETHRGETASGKVMTVYGFEFSNQPVKLLAYHEQDPSSIVLADTLPEPARKFLYEEANNAFAQ